MHRPLVFVSALALTLSFSPHAQASAGLLRARASRCLDVTNGDFANGTHPQLWDCSSSNTNQQWQLVNGQLQTSQNKCLDVVDGRNENGASVQLWDCVAGSANQGWQIDGVALKHTGTNFCLDVKDGAFDNGGQLQLWDCDGRPNGNQVWSFEAGQKDFAAAQTGAQTAVSSATTSATSFYNYAAISTDAFISLHPECAPFKDAVVAAAADQGLNAVFLLAIAETESSCQAAPSNGFGSFQFSDDGAWNQFGGIGKDRQNIWDASYAAARYFKYLLEQNNNNLDQAMRAYNGPLSQGGNPNYQKEVATWMSGGNPWS